MLNLFRRLRKSVAGSNATKKYVVYAVGEIALVVIGILLALQINNWNEERKRELDERNVLRSIRSELVENQKIFDTCVEGLDVKREGMAWIRSLKKDESRKYARDTLLRKLAWGIGETSHCTPNTDMLDDVKGSGKLGLIQNEELRIALANWTAQLKDLKSEEESWEMEFQDQFLPFTYDIMAWNDLDRLFNTDDPNFPPSKFDLNPSDMFETLKFENLVAINYWRVNRVKDKVVELHSQNKKVIEMIDDILSI